MNIVSTIIFAATDPWVWGKKWVHVFRKSVYASVNVKNPIWIQTTISKLSFWTTAIHDITRTSKYSSAKYRIGVDGIREFLLYSTPSLEKIPEVLK